MKKVRKLSIMTMLAVFMLSLGSSSASAAYGWGDSIYDPIVLYNSYTEVNNAMFPIESTSDYDFYLIDNRSGSSYITYTLSVKSPPGLNFDIQFITVDSSGNIISVSDGYDTGTGGTDGRGASVQAGQALYVKVYSHGSNDYSPDLFYDLRFSIR